ncbi:YifB family Mg chelatase-like AAA ATPase [Microlunatus soli]|uniref:Magnesium chelatase family protein n=1 Tax=Microlunatus soli TaxID=630515 RepID=A0A1H1N1F0_9ACTN|nr:YifB family Mg chelatase-like AAA ATPase [Microlunatus soli]SDR92806.1 magnesium chelatase family protein [Microlunatus soli]
MTLASSWSVALVGLEGKIVEIEADLGAGLPRTVLVGLPDTALYESRDRCKAAISNSGRRWPDKLVTINLSPASLPKAGAHYDLGIVSAVLAADEAFKAKELVDTVFLGELGLDGRVRPVRGLLPALLAASQHGFRRAVVPHQQSGEASLVDGLEIFGVASLAQLIALLRGEPLPEPPPPDPGDGASPADPRPVVDRRQLDMLDVAGQLDAKWALEVAAAGRHHVFFNGPPGVGKTMLAERLPGLLPDLALPEALEVSAIHSLAGIALEDGLITRPPFSAPHHSASVPSMVGGGHRVAKPGAISRAHRGVLFLDEAPEFSSRVLEALRTPLESGRVTIGRSESEAHYPARFQLVLAANPCPCGQSGMPGGRCECTPMAIRRYRERLSGPIRDRIDLLQTLLPMKKSFLKAALARGEPTSVVADRVRQARDRQQYRLTGTSWRTNGDIAGSYLRRHLPLPDGIEMLDRAVATGALSPRGVDKTLRISWTLADLAGVDRPGRQELQIALAMRRGESSSAATQMRVV